MHVKQSIYIYICMVFDTDKETKKKESNQDVRITRRGILSLEKNLVGSVLGKRFLQQKKRWSVNFKGDINDLTHVGKDDTAPDHCFRRQRNFGCQNSDANLSLDFLFKLLFAIDS